MHIRELLNKMIIGSLVDFPTEIDFGASNIKADSFELAEDGDLATFVKSQTTAEELTAVLLDYLKTTDIETGFINPAELAAALADYTTTSALTTLLTDYPTDTQLATILEDYYTETEMATVLTDYPTDTQLATILEDYYTETEMATVLLDYYTKTEIGAFSFDIQVFHVDDLAHTQNQLPLDVISGDAAQFVVPLDCDIVSLAVSSNAAITAGTMTFEILVDGVEVAAFTAVLDSTHQSVVETLEEAVTAAQVIEVVVSTTADVSATGVIGAGDNGVVTATVVAPGVDGNVWTIEVVLGTGISQALGVVIDDEAHTIVVTLATDGSELPDDSANTATLIAAAITNDASVLVTAAASGTGNDAISAAEGPTTFSGGTNELDPTGSADIVASLAFKL